MGMYDVLALPNGEYAQVKIFDNLLNTYEIGNVVPMPGDYSVKLEEGGWANFVNGRYASWTPTALLNTQFNKWGRRLYEDDA